MHDIRSALEAVGLDPAVGFLHRDRPGRPSLALDLLEEFRAFFAARLVLSLINRRQLGMGAFRRLENGACQDFGQRVQFSVFECAVEPAQWVALKSRLTAEIDASADSLRFYNLAANWKLRVERVGAREVLNLDGPLVVWWACEPGVRSVGRA